MTNRYRVIAQQTISYADWVEAESYEDAEAIVNEWIADDFSETFNEWTVEIGNAE